MLHIKLPKGKVSQTCERAGEQCSRRIVVANDLYRNELERWRKDSDQSVIRTVERCSPPDKPRDVELLLQARNELHDMADMAKHSVGDVYVSPELWWAIKGVY